MEVIAMATKDELDNFWDLDKLVPKKKRLITPFSSVNKTVTFTTDDE